MRLRSEPTQKPEEGFTAISQSVVQRIVSSLMAGYLEQIELREGLSIPTGEQIRVADPVRFEAQVEFAEIPEHPISEMGLSDTTPSVLNLLRIKFNNSVAITVTDFLDGQDGQQITILGDGITTLQHNTRINTITANNYLLAANTTYLFTYYDGVWIQLSGTAALSFANTNLTTDVTLAVAGTYYDGPGVTLAAGTWLINAQVTVKHTKNDNVVFVARLSTGSTHYSSTEVHLHNKNPNLGNINMSTIVTLSTSTSIKIQATCNHSTSDCYMVAATTNYGSGNNATQISAIRIG